MHPFGPAPKVMLIKLRKSGSMYVSRKRLEDSRATPNARYLCLRDALGKWRQPTLRTPFECIRSPDALVRVQAVYVDDDLSVRRDMNASPIRKGQDSINERSADS